MTHNKHESCFLCLGEAHNVGACSVCQHFTPSAQRDRASKIWEKALSSSIPSKVKWAQTTISSSLSSVLTTEPFSGPPSSCSVPMTYQHGSSLFKKRFFCFLHSQFSSSKSSGEYGRLPTFPLGESCTEPVQTALWIQVPDYPHPVRGN